MQGLRELVKTSNDFMEPENEQAKKGKGNRLMDKACRETEAEFSNGLDCSCVRGI